MKRKTRKRSGYKFTHKKRSVKGGIASAFGIASILAFGAVIVLSFQEAGNGTVYLGSVGLFSMLFAILALVIGIGSLKEDTYRTLPVLGTTLGAVSSVVWICLYIIGFILI